MFGIYNIELNNGDKKFAVKYTPAKLDIVVDGEFPFDEFEEMFIENMGSLYELGSEIIPFVENLSSKNKLKPLTGFAISQTRELLRNNSVLNVLENNVNIIYVKDDDENISPLNENYEDSRVKIDVE